MSHSSRAATDRNLLFGILALQMDFISRDALILAMNAWVLEKTKPLGQLLVEQGAMAEDARVLLEPLVQKHLQMHSDDAVKSLASVGSVGSARQALEQIADADVQASLAHIPAAGSVAGDLWPTVPPSVGMPTSAGLRFRVLRPHAKGGLGQVSVALDEELRREVALKEIQDRFADDRNSRARFLLEAEVTGGLEHPGIVPVYGLGSYPDGRPFYAMRFIKGDSLQEAIVRFHKAESGNRDPRERTLALRQLLGRFIDVCDAIAYAHSRGVLHRDLKPGNVMLGPYGETLVVDWGLAKPMGTVRAEGNEIVAERPLQPVLSNSATPTQPGRAIGTPAYMPPEQAVGRLDELGPASDVYSLGATLYCLLTGKSPFEGGGVGEILRKVEAGDFPRPREVWPDVSAALEAVCLKAMALKLRDRYPGPRALAADVERWLADEPVSAWREPLRLRVGRWARRHQTLMAAAATGVLVLVLAAGTGAWWLDRLRTEQWRGVESALAEVERLQEQGRWSEARAVLRQARERLGQSGPRDLQERLDQGERNLDLVAGLDAIRLKRATLIEGGFDIKGADREYEEAFRDLGRIEVNSNVEAAAALVRESAVRDALLAALDDWAICANERQRRTWLLSVAQEADADPWRKRVRDPAIWEDKAALMQLMSDEEISQQSPQLLAALGWRLQKLGGDAEPLLRTAQQRHGGDFWINFLLGNALLDKRPSDAVGYYLAALAVRPGTTAAHNNLGNALRNMGRLKEAVAAFHKAIELDPNMAPAHCNLGDILADMRRFKEAVAEYRQAIDLAPKHTIPHYNLGNALSNMGRLKEAVAAFHKAIELDPKHAGAHNNLGIALRDMRRFEEAIAEFRQAIGLDPKLAAAHNNLGTALRDMRRFEEAIAEYHKAIELDPKYPPAHNNLGVVLRDMGQFKEAVAEFRKAIGLDPKYAAAHYSLGSALYNMGQLKEAVAAFHKAIEFDPKDANTRTNLGNALEDMGRFEEAVAAYHKAIELDPKHVYAHYNLGIALMGMGQLKEAVAEFRKAIEFDPNLTLAHKELARSERMAALDKELTAFLEGSRHAANAEEELLLVELCRIKKRYAAAVRFYTDAFTAQPKLAEDLRASHRYNSACFAALAAAGQGEDAAKLDAKERARLRQQARDWLRADLELRSKQIEKGTPSERAAAQATLRHWQQDADLAGLRDKGAVTKLPEAERADCRKLWEDVAALLKKTEAKKE